MPKETSYMSKETDYITPGGGILTSEGGESLFPRFAKSMCLDIERETGLFVPGEYLDPVQDL